MQFTATKLFTAFLALIALIQFVSGAALYSEMKDDAKITVTVSDVALTDGCAPTVSGLFSLVFVFCWFRKFSSSSWTTRLRRRFGDENITNASRIGENIHSSARFVLYFVGFFFARDGKASVCISLRGVPLKIWKM